MSKKRCEWVTQDLIYIDYHDKEWGRPVHDDKLLFEFLILEGMQAGLSWLTVLKKRENFRQAFDNFNPKLIAEYDQKKIDQLLQDKGIIRNKLKINAAINNAKALLKLEAEKQMRFSEYLWEFVENKPIFNHWQQLTDVPTSTVLSDKLSKDLKNHGFKFVGTTICYAFMQAVGMVNDHVTSCFCYKERHAN